MLPCKDSIPALPKRVTGQSYFNIRLAIPACALLSRHLCRNCCLILLVKSKEVTAKDFIRWMC